MLAPKQFVLPHVHELSTDSEIVSALHDSTREDCVDAEFISNRNWIDFFVLVTEDRAGRTNLQVWQLRQTINKRLCSPIRKILSVRFRASVLEWQHGYRLNRDFTVSSVHVKGYSNHSRQKNHRSNAGSNLVLFDSGENIFE